MSRYTYATATAADEVAQLIAEVYEGSFYYVPERNNFFIWDGARWSEDTDNTVYEWVRGVAREIEKVAGEHESSAINEETLAAGVQNSDEKGVFVAKAKMYRGKAAERRKVVKYLRSPSGHDGVVTQLKRMPGITKSMEEFDVPEDSVNTRYGTLHISAEGVELTQFDADELRTTLVDVEYDEHAECPRWEQFLNECFPDQPEMPGYLQRLVGYALLGRRTEHIMPVLYGPRGRNGKSTFIKTLTGVLSNEVVIHPKFSSFTEKGGNSDIRVDLIALQNKRIAFSSEGDRQSKIDSALVKELTSHDVISARLPYARKMTQFQTKGVIMLVTNFEPNIDGSDAALFRRVKQIEWRQEFTGEREILGLDEILLAERVGIFRWIVDGAIAYLRHGFQEPASVTRATEDLKNANDPLYGFLPGIYVSDPDVETPTNMKTIHQDYESWVVAESIPAKLQYGRRGLGKALKNAGVRTKKNNKGDTAYCVRKVADVERTHRIRPDAA